MSSILGGRENGSGLGVVMWCKVKRVVFLVTGVFWGIVRVIFWGVVFCVIVWGWWGVFGVVGVGDVGFSRILYMACRVYPYISWEISVFVIMKGDERCGI